MTTEEIQFRSFITNNLSVVQQFLRKDPDGILMATGYDATPAIEAVEAILNKIGSER